MPSYHHTVARRKFLLILLCVCELGFILSGEDKYPTIKSMPVAASVRCSSVLSPRLATDHPKPGMNVAPCNCGSPCPAPSYSSAALPTALIISGSARCFARARAEVERGGGFTSVERIAAEFID